MYSISSSIIKDDEFRFDKKANKKCPPSPLYIFRSYLRIFEVVSRFIELTLLWLQSFGFVVLALLATELLVYLYFFRCGLIGSQLCVLSLSLCAVYYLIFSRNNTTKK